MEGRFMTEEQIRGFEQYLKDNEREKSTREKYLHDVRSFHVWLDGRPLTKELLRAWKDSLIAGGLAASTVNCRIAAVNKFLRYAGWKDCRVRLLRVQKRVYRDTSRELTREEYKKLVSTATALGLVRLAMVLETICSLGIRVSELKYITVEAIERGCAEISMKGKIRTILIPRKLCLKLRRYVRSQKLTSGEIFLSRGGRSLSRKQIWADMKALCKKAGVDASKVFPHNLRHLFARRFYETSKDIAKLADVLGHSNIETTRMYLISTGIEHERTMERLCLIL